MSAAGGRERSDCRRGAGAQPLPSRLSVAKTWLASNPPARRYWVMIRPQASGAKRLARPQRTAGCATQGASGYSCQHGTEHPVPGRSPPPAGRPPIALQGRTELSLGFALGVAREGCRPLSRPPPSQPSARQRRQTACLGWPRTRRWHGVKASRRRRWPA